ncbi:hypothetical protein Tco_0619856 [Tanacetum coccineum]
MPQLSDPGRDAGITPNFVSSMVKVGHTTDECMHLNKKIEEMLKAGKLDEFRGCKVTIFVQRNYWKTMSQETTSSSVNNSWNAKAPGKKRSHYPQKQQVGPAGMRISLQTRRDPLGY